MHLQFVNVLYKQYTFVHMSEKNIKTGLRQKCYEKQLQSASSFTELPMFVSEIVILKPIHKNERLMARVL